MLVQIISDYFCVGIVVDQDYIVRSAGPIVKYMIGWNMDKVVAYCNKKKWKYEIL